MLREDILKSRMMRIYKHRFKKITLPFYHFTNPKDQKATLIYNPCHPLEPNIIKLAKVYKNLQNKARFSIILSVYRYLPKISSKVIHLRNTTNSSMAQNSKQFSKKYFKKTSKISFPKKSSRESGIRPFKR